LLHQSVEEDHKRKKMEIQGAEGS